MDVRAILAAVVIGVACARPAPPVPVVAAGAPSQLCVVRHAQAFKNLSPPPRGLSADMLDALTPDGVVQARTIGERLPRGVVQTWTSPTQRTRQTAALLGTGTVAVTAELRPLDGERDWDEARAGWASGADPRPPGGESLADGAARVEALLDRVRDGLPEGGHVVFVTHGDIAALTLGALRGTPLLERPIVDALGTGEMACVPIAGEEP